MDVSLVYKTNLLHSHYLQDIYLHTIIIIQFKPFMASTIPNMLKHNIQCRDNICVINKKNLHI